MRLAQGTCELYATAGRLHRSRSLGAWWDRAQLSGTAPGSMPRPTMASRCRRRDALKAMSPANRPGATDSCGSPMGHAAGSMRRAPVLKRAAEQLQGPMRARITRQKIRHASRRNRSLPDGRRSRPPQQLVCSGAQHHATLLSPRSAGQSKCTHRHPSLQKCTTTPATSVNCSASWRPPHCIARICTALVPERDLR